MKMKPNYNIHEDMYVEARQAGWDGWGGNERMAKATLVDRFLEIVDRPQQGTLLELGCGEGHHCRGFSQLGFEVTGIDISTTAINWAKEKAEAAGIKGNYYVADLTTESLELPKRYNVVIDGNCLHCIIGEDRSIVLNHINRSLLQDGIFFISSLCSKDDNSYEAYRDNLPYRHIASQKSLIAELECAGFRVVNTTVYDREMSNHITIHAVKA
ncbi:SAM-dependent methyltransferase [Veronia nyctiphanis]|uniref:SAM-dependent methyltransferase n=1 Tax=Veronia nyctiphanis TaxID=1278244 RepID=A0A4Q0YYM5_9GAMM|nr:SAM-dependent methyltransferase [Veronia nyctiphanis]